jgi:phage shock protein A
MQWQSRAESAVSAGDDALARQAILRRQENEKIAASLADEHAAVHEAALTLRRQLEAMQAKSAEAKRRLGTLIARKKAAAVQSKIQLASQDPDWNQDAFAKFERLREKVELAEAEAEALRELSGDPILLDTLATEIATRDLEVESELEQLKKKLQSSIE